MVILGLTGGFHYGSCDASCTILKDGKIVSSVEEERLTRIKNSFSIPPTKCIKSALEVANFDISDVDHIALFVSGYPEARNEMHAHISSLFGSCPPISLVDHHMCHAASSYYASGFKKATVVTFDWSGDGVSSSIWSGIGDQLHLVDKVKKPNSLGMYYAAITQFLGFERGDEYKVMGLSSFGKPNVNLDRVLDTSNAIYNLNTEIFDNDCRNMNQLIINNKLKEWYPEYWRPRNGEIRQTHWNMAASAQLKFEKAARNFVKLAVEKTKIADVCIAGGAAMNCTSNGKLLNEDFIEKVFVPPFPNDTGCSYGAASVISVKNNQRVESISTAQWGPSFSNSQIKKDIDLLGINCEYVEDIESFTAKKIASNDLVGWFQGRMEVGPRALGGRSILANPRDKKVKDRINKFVKFRETFRPFAPSVLLENCEEFFELKQESPFMSFVAKVKTPDLIPGVTHVDGTARVQTVRNRETEKNNRYYHLLTEIEKNIGCPVVLNTSFNYMGQPIVCSPKEAIYTFFGTGLNHLMLGNYVISK